MATNREALDETLRYVATDPADAARVQLAQSLAEAVDANPKNAQLWRVYRDAVEALYAHDDTANDDLKEALAKIASASPIRHTAKV